MAIQSLVLDPSAAPTEIAPVNVRNETGSPFAAGDLLFLSGWNEAQGRHLAQKADADVLGAHAVLIMQGALADATDGQAYRSSRLTDLDTSSGVEGDPVYLDAALPGGWTLTAPTGASAIRQVIGRVAVVNATTGEIEFDLANQVLEQVGSNELQDSAVAAAKIASTAVDNTKLASTAAKDNLDDLGDTARGYIKTNPTVGEFKVIAVHRQSDGKLDVEYDDDPVV